MKNSLTTCARKSDNKQQKLIYKGSIRYTAVTTELRSVRMREATSARRGGKGSDIKFSSTTWLPMATVAEAGLARSLRERSEGGEVVEANRELTRWWWSDGGKGSGSWRAKGENLRGASGRVQLGPVVYGEKDSPGETHISCHRGQSTVAYLAAVPYDRPESTHRAIRARRRRPPPPYRPASEPTPVPRVKYPFLHCRGKLSA